MSSMNTKIALENMVLARDALAKRGVPLFLNFGTLLGAVREHDFIPHDHDVDSGIFDRDRAALDASLLDLAEAGLALFEIWPDGRCYSLQRGGEQIDIFIAREKRGLFTRSWNLDGKVSIPAIHLDSLDEIDFLGYTFKVPHDPIGVVRNLYGKTWNIPLDGKPCRIDLPTRVWRALTMPRKTLAYAPTFIGNRIKWALTAARSIRGRRPGA